MPPEGARLLAAALAALPALIASCTTTPPEQSTAVSQAADPSASAARAPAAPASPEPEPLSTGLPQGSVRLSFVGDLALTSSLGAELARRSHGLPVEPHVTGDYPFGEVAARLRAADLLVGNLECVASPLGRPAIEATPLRCPVPVLDTLAGVGFDVLSVANNHVMDFGREAFADMLRRIEERRLAHIGSRGMLFQAPQAVVREVKGLRIGLLGCYYLPQPPYAAVTAVRRRADVVAIYLHWGREDHAEPTEQQRRLAGDLLGAGADLVVGAHAHVLGPVERHGRGLVAYGLGNFVFDALPPTAARRTGAILEVEVDRRGVRAHRLLRTHLNGPQGLSFEE